MNILQRAIVAIGVLWITLGSILGIYLIFQGFRYAFMGNDSISSAARTTFVFGFAFLVIMCIGATFSGVVFLVDLFLRVDKDYQNQSKQTLSQSSTAEEARRQKGVDTENWAGLQLQGTAPNGWQVDLAVWRERGGDFDAVVRGPNRQHFVVEIKSHRGAPRRGSDGHFYLGNDQNDKVMAQVLDQALESGTAVVVWQPLASHASTRINGVTFISGGSAGPVWAMMTQQR